MAKVQLYNYRLDTSNPEKTDEKFDSRQVGIKEAWVNITLFFLEKGKSVQFQYWPEDFETSPDIIKYISASEDTLQRIDPFQLLKLNAHLTPKIKAMIEQNVRSNRSTISPYFHFDILNEKEESIYTSQDFGDNTLLCLKEFELNKLAATFSGTHVFISLPESIEENV